MYDNKAIKAYAAYAKDDSLRLSSSSGAVFSLLAEYILSQNGVVYGVALSADCKGAEFVRADCLDGLSRLRGSKYMQARAGNCYDQVRADLENGINVLFSGTGCQVNGLKLFLQKSYENLFCVDVICHGVPSLALWRKYVEHMERRNGAKLISVNFRCKEDGWQDFGMKAQDDNQKEIYISKDKDPFMQMFLRDYCLRPSCYECVAKRVKMSDMTIADFWGIERIAPDMNDGRGTSLVLIRNEKGATLFERVSSRMIYKKVSYEDGVRGNPAEYQSVSRPEERDAFFQDMDAFTFDALQKKYAASVPVSFVQWAKRKAKKAFPGFYERYCMLRGNNKENKFSGGGVKIMQIMGFCFDLESRIESWGRMDHGKATACII